MVSKLNSYGTFEGPHGGLFYEREGNPEGQSILFVHGLGGTTNAYQLLVPELQEFDLVRFDWSGHGRSSTPKTTSIASYVEDCEAIMRHLSLMSVVVAAHSLGGLVALHLAAKRPEAVKALVLFGPVRSPPEAGQKGLAARAEAVRKSEMAEVADTVVSNAFAAQSYSHRKGVVALAREMLARTDSEGYALACEALKNSMLPDWGNIKAKVVVLSGEEDKVSTVPAGQATVSDIGGNAEQQILSGVGHWHILEEPAACIEVIKQFAA